MLNQFEVIQTYWLDDPEFTEGLYYDNQNNRIIESTGLEGESEIRTYRFDNDDGEIVDIQTLFLDNSTLFGEGTTRFDDQYYQLSYHNGIITIFHEENIGTENDTLIIDRIAAQPRDENCTLHEGWGLTASDDFLYMSDGSNRIYRFTPDDLQDFTPDYLSLEFEDECPEEYTFPSYFEINDTETGEPIYNINELEMVGNYIFANIWLTNTIIKIHVYEDRMEFVRSYDFTILREITCDRIAQMSGNNNCDSQIDVLNGIAYDSNHNEFILTGKEWPLVFRITISDNTFI